MTLSRTKKRRDAPYLTGNIPKQQRKVKNASNSTRSSSSHDLSRLEAGVRAGVNSTTTRSTAVTASLATCPFIPKATWYIVIGDIANGFVLRSMLLSVAMTAAESAGASLSVLEASAAYYPGLAACRSSSGCEWCDA